RVCLQIGIGDRLHRLLPLRRATAPPTNFGGLCARGRLAGGRRRTGGWTGGGGTRGQQESASHHTGHLQKRTTAVDWFCVHGDYPFWISGVDRQYRQNRPHARDRR